jgi:dihydrofolate reductase
MMITVVVAAAENDVIGADGALPWHVPADLRHFQKLTTGHVVVMGRRTHESILRQLGHPLARRASVVLSRGAAEASPEGGLVWASSADDALNQARRRASLLGTDEVFVIGGASVYEAALPFADRIVLTRIHQPFVGDVRMPRNWLDGFTEVVRNAMIDDSSGIPFSITTYRRAGYESVLL